MAQLGAALVDLYGERLESAVLFGSRARGDVRRDSDYDVAVFLTDIPDRWLEFDRLAELRVRFLDEVGVFIDAKPYPANALQDRTPLMHEVRRDGVRLCHGLLTVG